MKFPQGAARTGLSAVLATTLCCPVTALAAEPATVEEDAPSASQVASPRTIASGTWGSCTWTIDNAGALVVNSGTGQSMDNQSPWAAYADSITSVSFSGAVTAPGDISGLFKDLYALRSANLNGLRTASTTDLHGLFNGCTSLVTVNLGGIDTGNVTLFDAMFRNCSSLRSLDVSSLDTSRGLRFEGMFQGCSSLTSLNASGLDVSNASHMENMFQGCTSLTTLDLSSFASTRCSYFQNMFADCSSLKTLDLSNLGTGAAVNMTDMFASCSSLEHIRLGNQFSFAGSGSNTLTLLPSATVNGHADWFSSTTQSWMSADEIARSQNKIYAVYAKYPVAYEADPNPSTPVNPGDVTASGMWGSCAWTLDSAGTLIVSSGSGERLDEQDSAPWSSVADSIKHVRFEGRVVAPIVVCGLFRNCSNLESIDLDGLDTSGTEVMSWFFYGCSSLASIDLSPLNTSRLINTNNMFTGCRSLKSLDLSPLDTPRLIQMDEMFQECSSLESIDFTGFDTSNVTKMGYLFYGCSSLKYVDLSPLDMSRNTSLAEMFAYCTSLVSVGLKGLNTSNVTAMDGMFNGCTSLSYVDFAGLDTSRVTTFRDMFNGCSSLRAFDASNLNTRSATSMSYMFCGCTALTSLDLSSFNTSNVTDFSNMFRGAENLRSLNVSGWNTARATNMAEMFFACPYVTYFDLTSFNTSNVRDMHGMFRWCTYTQRIDLSSFNTRSCDNMDNMFEGCVRLVRMDVGPAFSFTGSGNTWCVFPDGDTANYYYTDWYSTALGAWVLPADIPASYSNMATTYQKTVETPSIWIPQKSPFSDVPNDQWYSDAVDYIAAKGLISGYGGTDRYGVGDTLTRAQLATILWRYANPNEAMLYDDEQIAQTVNETGMSDVEGYAWYTGAANWAVENGVINGYSGADGKPYAFGPNDPVTFEQLVVILGNLTSNGASQNAPVSVLDRFVDADTVSGWAASSMAWAVSQGLVNGGNGYLNPLENATRERTAMVLSNAFNLGIMK